MSGFDSWMALIVFSCGLKVKLFMRDEWLTFHFLYFLHNMLICFPLVTSLYYISYVSDTNLYYGVAPKHGQTHNQLIYLALTPHQLTLHARLYASSKTPLISVLTMITSLRNTTRISIGQLN